MAEARVIETEGENSKTSRKKQFGRKCESDQWNFLSGVGPSAPTSNAFRPNSPERFKPGWMSKRREEAIGQDKQRIDLERMHDERAAKNAAVRKDFLQSKEQLSGQNPVTGELQGNGLPLPRPTGKKRIEVETKMSRVKSSGRQWRRGPSGAARLS